MRKSILHQVAHTVAFVLLSSMLGSCYSYKPLVMTQSNPGENSTLITPGGRYKIKLKEGLEIEITVRRMDAENLYGIVKLVNVGRDLDSGIRKNPNGVIARNNILSISRRRINLLETITLASTAVLITIGLGGFIIAKTNFGLYP